MPLANYGARSVRPGLSANEPYGLCECGREAAVYHVMNHASAALVMMMK